MNLVSMVSKFGSGIVDFASKNSTSIMTVGAVVGVGATAYLSGKASIKAYKAIEELEYTSEKAPTNKDKFKRVWKFYIPPFASAVATVTLLLGAQSINMQRQAALFNAYYMADTARKEFEKSAEKVVGKGKVNKIHEDVMKEKVSKNPPTEENTIYTKHGDILCFDEMSGRFFKSDIEYIRSVYNKLNNRINCGEHISPNDIYYELDLPPIELGDSMEWSSRYTGLIELRLQSGKTVNEIPYLSIGYYNPPVPKYWKED